MSVCGEGSEDGAVAAAKWLATAKDALTQEGVFVFQSYIGGARVPVLKMRHKATLKPVDITVNNLDVMANTNLLRTYASWDPRVRQLGALVKTWAKHAGVCGAADG